MPRHCSSSLNNVLTVPLDVKQKESESCKSSFSRKRREIVVIVVRCRNLVAFRALYPLLFESSPHLSRKALRILTRRFCRGRIRLQDSGMLDVTSLSKTHYRRSRAQLNDCNLLLYLLPSSRTEVDYYFSGELIRYEHIWLQMQTLSAYYATLGGGYFLCRKLSTAIQLARRQRWVATWMGDYAMADRCTLNESYNYLHAGQFDVAFAMLKTLKVSARVRNDVVLWKMCKSARLLGKRMKRAGKRGGAESNIDDYQRIRFLDKL